MSYPSTMRLGDVASFVRGITFKPGNVVPVGSPESMACMRTKNVQEEIDLGDVWGIPERLMKRTNQELSEGDLLISSANSWNLVGKCCWVPKLPWRSTFGGFITVLRADKARVEPRYLYHWFSSRHVQATVRSYGQQTTNISNLNVDRCTRLPIFLPHLSEQRRIAEVLDKADALRTKRRAAIEQLDGLMQSIFLDMFGDPINNLNGWPLRDFGKICDTRLGKMLDRKKQTGEHPRQYLRNANVQWFRFDLSSLFEMDFNQDDRRLFKLKKGDLLICEGGEPGRAAVWRGALSECYFQKALHRARPDPHLATAEYLSWLLWFLSRSGSLRGVTSATIAHLTGEKLAVLPVMLPPMARQRAFSDRLALLESAKQHSVASLAELDALFSSLQHRAFRGEL